MRRETLSSDYEEFEPDIPIWPYVVLSFLVPLVPFVLTILLGGGVSLALVLRLVYSILPLLMTASIIRHGENVGLLAGTGGVIAVTELVIWVSATLSGKTPQVPVGIMFVPSVLPIAAYTFFQKRRHGKWLGTFLVSFLALGIFSFMVYRYWTIDLLLVYPATAAVLVFLILFVTRRTDSTPWFILIPLVVLLLESLVFTPGVVEMLGGAKADPVGIILSTFTGNQQFWFSVTMLFVFSGLASKSSYRRRYEENESFEEFIAPSVQSYDDQGLEEREWKSSTEESAFTPNRDSGRSYVFPPDYSRYAEEERRPEAKPEPVEEAKTEPRVPRSPSYESEYRDKSSDDKWYEFISGGVAQEPPRQERREERRDDYPRYREDERRYLDDRDDYYYRRDYDRRREEEYPPRRYDERPSYPRDDRDRYYDDRDRYSRERRDYYDRLMDDRDRDRDRDRDDRRRYYDDERDPRR